jgi:hypothetical protein
MFLGLFPCKHITLNGDRFDVTVTSNDRNPTVRDVKTDIAACPSETIPLKGLRLNYKGHILESETHILLSAILPWSTLF